MKYKTILITGGAGFIGSNLAVAFKTKYPRLKVIALDNLKRRGSELNIARLKENGVLFVHGDIRCPEDLRLNIKSALLIECSAEPSVLAGFGENPAYIINTNLSGTVNCLELARKNSADVIFLSTSRVYPYGGINAIKCKETENRFQWSGRGGVKGWSKKGISEGFSLSGPKTLYGATKLASEFILQEYISNYGLKGVINRCGVVAGAWQFGKADQGVFTLWMLAHYFKNDLNYIGFGSKGKQVRDLLAVEDLFRLVERQAMELGKINGRIYNVGGGLDVSLSLLETTALCEKFSGNRINIGSEPKPRPGDIAIYITDNTKVTKELGWQPQIAAEDILDGIYCWINQYERQIRESLF
ncbi:MAG: NAD-dependent epimerase/dehydratase family protein [Candidatus Omnitrophica bacterium]|nr:NAD-dependent epimerase/dehydratase family protein [Candidatus Omnitrophota bacterium]